MTNQEQHIENLWKISEAGLDIDDIGECISALNIKYGVRYKTIYQLSDKDSEICVDKFESNVEEMFLDRINTMGRGYYEFQRFCLLFMDFKKMYKSDKPTEIFDAIATLVQQNNETRFGFKVKENAA